MSPLCRWLLKNRLRLAEVLLEKAVDGGKCQNSEHDRESSRKVGKCTFKMSVDMSVRREDWGKWARLIDE
jgi:hypothetical protein